MFQLASFFGKPFEQVIGKSVSNFSKQTWPISIKPFFRLRSMIRSSDFTELSTFCGSHSFGDWHCQVQPSNDSIHGKQAQAQDFDK